MPERAEHGGGGAGREIAHDQRGLPAGRELSASGRRLSQVTGTPVEMIRTSSSIPV
jgi:hypothetical protein